MTKRDKLVARFLSRPSDFKYAELIRLLGYFGYAEMKTGKTSGSRVKFIHPSGDQIRLHMPHSKGVLKNYQMMQVKRHLNL